MKTNINTQSNPRHQDKPVFRMTSALLGFVCVMLLFFQTASAAPEWGDWHSINGNIDYSTKTVPDGSGDRGAVTVYWKFRNNTPRTVHITVTFQLANGKTEPCEVTLKPNEVRTDQGFWTSSPIIFARAN